MSPRMAATMMRHWFAVNVRVASSRSNIGRFPTKRAKSIGRGWSCQDPARNAPYAKQLAPPGLLSPWLRREDKSVGQFDRSDHACSMDRIVEGEGAFGADARLLKPDLSTAAPVDRDWPHHN